MNDGCPRLCIRRRQHLQLRRRCGTYLIRKFRTYIVSTIWDDNNNKYGGGKRKYKYNKGDCVDDMPRRVHDIAGAGITSKKG